MQTARRRRTGWAIAASLVVHLTVGVVILLQKTSLPTPPDLGGPPEAIIPILILPKTPPPASGRQTQPTPIRLHRRPQPFAPSDVTPAPIAPPAPPAAAKAAPAAPPALHPAPQPEGPTGDVRTALRGGYVGCANAQAVGLTRAERDLCDEKLGKGAKDAQFAGLGLNAEKQGLLDAAGARKESDYRYKHSQGPAIGVARSGGFAVPTAEEQAGNLGNDRPKLTVPF